MPFAMQVPNIDKNLNDFSDLPNAIKISTGKHIDLCVQIISPEAIYQKFTNKKTMDCKKKPSLTEFTSNLRKYLAGDKAYTAISAQFWAVLQLWVGQKARNKRGRYRFLLQPSGMSISSAVNPTVYSAHVFSLFLAYSFLLLFTIGTCCNFWFLFVACSLEIYTARGHFQGFKRKCHAAKNLLNTDKR